MKKLLLFTLLGITPILNAQIYINELLVSPPGDDIPFEYVELRGTPNSTIPAGTYLVNIEGDGSSNPGDLDEIVDLSGQVFGSAGYLVLVSTGHPYPIDAGASILLDAYDGNFEDQSHSFFLIQTATPPTSSDDIDSDDDGTPDGSVYSGWTVLDSVSIVEADNVATETEVGYGAIIYIEDLSVGPAANFLFPSTSVIVETGTQASYVGRQGTSTGYDPNTDWVCTAVNSTTASTNPSNPPNWNFSGNSANTIPNAFEDFTLNHYGSVNPTAATLSITEQELTKDISFFPNPTNNVINIKSKNDIISSIEIVDATGKLLVTKNNDLDVVDLTNLTTGLYYMNVYGDGARITRTVVKN